VAPEAARKSSDAFLKGEILWTSRGDLKKSIALFEEAIQENPYNAQAYAGLARATAIIGQVPNDGMPHKKQSPRLVPRPSAPCSSIHGSPKPTLSWETSP